MTGEKEALEIARRIARLLLSYEASVDSERRRRQKSMVVGIWSKSQLPTLIKTCDLPLITTTARAFYASQGCKFTSQNIRQGIIEAFAGECRALQSEGEEQLSESFIRENGDALQQLHRQYLDHCRSRKPSDDEATAWEYLSQQLTPLLKKTRPRGGDPTTASQATVSPAVSTILDNPQFADVIRKGAHDAAYELVTEHLEEVRQLLMRRLDIRLLPEHLMRPEGRVFSSKAASRGQLDPTFVEAQNAINDSDFERASEMLDRLNTRLQGRPREFCRSWQAYALARNEELLLARQCLQELVVARFPYASAYWNLACCLPSEQMDRQLDVLGTGLEVAPHPRILNGAVFLAVLLNDERLKKWLLYLTIPEALLLAFQQQFEEMDAEERDRSLLRLSYYLKHGEPSVLNPMQHKIPHHAASSYINDLIQREQIKAAEFWLRCREAIGRRRIDFWQLKVALLHQTGRQSEAVRAFRKELQCRLEALGGGKFVPGNSPYQVLQRSAEWLRQCMTPELRETGKDIYRTLTEFADQHKKDVVPRDNRLREFFLKEMMEKTTSRSETPMPPHQRRSQGGGRLSAAGDSLSTIIAQAGAECGRELHEVEQISRVSNELEKLALALEKNGRDNSADCVRRLVQGWKSHRKNETKDQRQLSFQRSQLAYSELDNSFRRELTAEELVTAHLLLQALRRVNERLARSLDLLPELVLEPPTEDPIFVDTSVRHAGFALAVRSKPGSATCRLTACTATMDDGLTDFPLRDKLDEIEVEVGPEEGALLTFSCPQNFQFDATHEVQIVLHYEYAGEIFTTDTSSFSVSPRTWTPPPNQSSPYIFGRPLEPTEIEGHFFGREREQQMILEAVTDGQQRFHYIEGIRRSGKSSLLKSLQYEIAKRDLPLVPTYVSAQTVSPGDHAGSVLYNFFRQILDDSELISKGVTLPPEERCRENLVDAYSQFIGELKIRLPEHRVLVLLDDFQVLVEAGSSAIKTGSALGDGISGLLSLIRQYTGPNARLLWVLAGHRAQRQFRTFLPGILLWADLKPLRIDFLDLKSVADLITIPLSDTNFVVPPETVKRIHWHTAGHPEVVQEVGELMFLKAIEEKRTLLTPADVDECSRDIAGFSDKFADTWYPLGELTRDQRSFMAAFINAVPVGGRIDSSRLAPGKQLSNRQENAIDDLVARRILEYVDGEIRIKALVLDLWLHRAIPEMIADRVNGSIAIFIDVANLTAGTGASSITDLDTDEGDRGIPGRFELDAVLNAIEGWARNLSPAPIAARWVVNYPLKSPAVVVCSSKGYYVENVQAELWTKGSDDMILASKMWEVEDQYPTVNHFVLVLGDKDYKEVAIDRLLKKGKYVHLVSRRAALARRYQYLADAYPECFSATTLEELLERT